MAPSRDKPSLASPRPGVLARLREEIAARHYGLWVQREVLGWSGRFIRAAGIRHGGQVGRVEVGLFVEEVRRQEGREAAASAAWALVFLCRHVLGCRSPWLDSLLEAHPSRRWPDSLSRAQVRLWLAHLDEPLRLVALLIYGSGLGLGECLGLRLRDLDPVWARLRIPGSHGRQRVTFIALRAGRSLGQQLARVRRRHLAECRRGGGWTSADPRGKAGGGRTRRLEWQFLFPAEQPLPLPAGLARLARSYHLHPAKVEMALEQGAREVGLGATVGAPSLRHAFAAHLLEDGAEPEQVRALLGLAGSCLPDGVLGSIRSPLDAL